MTSWAAFRDEFTKVAAVRTPLRPHQQRVLDKMLQPDQPGLVVAHGLGAGKTLTSIAVQDALGVPAAVVLPAALQENYLKERTKHVSGPSPEAHMVTMQRVARSGELPVAPLAIIDEAHRAREIDTATHKALKKSLQGTEKRMLLTASPFYNRPSDVAGLINLAANEKVLTADPTEFKNTYVRQRRTDPGFFAKTFRGIKPGVVDELNPAKARELQGIFRRWVDYHPNNQDGFPAVSREVVKVPMTHKQLELYDTMLDQAPAWIKYKVRKGLPPSKAESKDLNAFLTAVRQVSLSTREHAPKVPPQEPKVDMAFAQMRQELGSNPRSKGVVYSNYLKTGLTPYKERLERAGISYGEFTGEMKKKDRDQLVRDYNSGKKRVLLLSSAGGEGLDLKGTRLLQILEPHWNAEKLKQVEGRGIRYKSHEHLPENERNIRVQNYIATRPEKGLLNRVGLTQPGGSADEMLTLISDNKERLIGQFKNLMKEPGHV